MTSLSISRVSWSSTHSRVDGYFYPFLTWILEFAGTYIFYHTSYFFPCWRALFFYQKRIIFKKGKFSLNTYRNVIFLWIFDQGLSKRWKFQVAEVLFWDQEKLGVSSTTTFGTLWKKKLMDEISWKWPFLDFFHTTIRLEKLHFLENFQPV